MESKHSTLQRTKKKTVYVVHESRFLALSGSMIDNGQGKSTNFDAILKHSSYLHIMAVVLYTYSLAHSPGISNRVLH